MPGETLRDRLVESITESFGTAPWYNGPEEDLPEGVTYETLQLDVDRHFADNATAVVAEWLREQAAARTKMAHSEDNFTVRTLLLVKADTLTRLADDLSPTPAESTEEQQP